MTVTTLIISKPSGCVFIHVSMVWPMLSGMSLIDLQRVFVILFSP